MQDRLVFAFGVATLGLALALAVVALYQMMQGACA